jgi:predicted polyphosphate/ATP-dependent NAD kinase
MLVGVLVNPIAGFGGALALHGTDALPAERFEEAVRAGHAATRLLHALDRFRDAGAAARFVAAPGIMGAHALAGSAIPYRALDATEPARTTRADTIDAARRLVAEGIDVLLFGGGDGTGTDIAEAVGTGVPVIGIPSGVKMHSEVFARSAASAGRLLADFVAGTARSELAEVLDVGPDDISGVVAVLLAPRSREALQGAKTSARPGSSVADGKAIAREVVASRGADVTWIIGPGGTAGAVAEELGFTPTLRGADVRHPSGEVELDVDEQRLHEIAMAASEPRLVLGVVGGQGFLLGRGNQQISPRVIERLGADRIEIVATNDKVAGLFPPVLFVDVGDDAGEPVGLLGYRRVRIGIRQSTVMKVSAA